MLEGKLDMAIRAVPMSNLVRQMVETAITIEAEQPKRLEKTDWPRR